MRLLVILCNIILIRAAAINEECNEIQIENVFYENEILKEGLDRPYQLAIDYGTNTVFFSYSLTIKDDEFKTAYVDLNTKEYSEIKGVNNGFAQAIDQRTHEVYIGGSDGIYKYNQKTKKAEQIGAKNNDIWNMYFKDVLYYSDFPPQFLYTLKNGEAVRFKDLEETKVDQFAIDNDDVIFYTNATGLYSHKIGKTNDTVLFKEFPNDGIRGLATDVNGNVYACLIDGIYTLDKKAVTITKLFDVDDAFGVAVDSRNNIIYSDATKLYRLNKDKTC